MNVYVFETYTCKWSHKWGLDTPTHNGGLRIQGMIPPTELSSE